MNHIAPIGLGVGAQGFVSAAEARMNAELHDVSSPVVLRRTNRYEEVDYAWCSSRIYAQHLVDQSGGTVTEVTE